MAHQYKIKKRVKEHHRKIRKEARKAKKLGLPIKQGSKLTRIPNAFPEKMQMLEEQDLMKDIQKNRGRHNLITVDDVKNLIQEESGQNVIKSESFDTPRSLSKYDTKKELNNIIKNSQIIIEVLDSRDPYGYRSKELEKKIIQDKDKRLIILLNKSDLVSNAEAWGKLFRRDIPTILFSSKSEENESTFKNLVEIINTLTPHMDKVHVSLCGFPNTGKSTFMSILKKKFRESSKSKLLPCEEVIVDKKIRFFDICGTILSTSDIGTLMPRSVKNVDDLKNPRTLVEKIFEAINHELLLETYEIAIFENLNEFLTNLALSRNLKIKGGYADLDRAAQLVISDVISGKIKYESPVE